jgi:hypothetical protein
MKNVFKVLGIIAIVAVIGFSMASCDDGGGGDKKDELIGKWVRDDGEYLNFKKGSWITLRFSSFQIDFNVSSYNGTTIKATGSWVPDISFTATIAGNKLTVSGLTKITDTSGTEIDLSVHNGTYIKE